MTEIDKAVTRRTCAAYRIAVSGAHVDPISGRKLVVELHNNGKADLVRIRESGRKKWVELDIAELYRRALIAESRIR